MNFNDHIYDLRKKASRKISALARVTPFMGLSKRKMNMLHERCPRIIYNDKQSSFTELVNKDNSV